MKWNENSVFKLLKSGTEKVAWKMKVVRFWVVLVFSSFFSTWLSLLVILLSLCIVIIINLLIRFKPFFVVYYLFIIIIIIHTHLISWLVIILRYITVRFLSDLPMSLFGGSQKLNTCFIWFFCLVNLRKNRFLGFWVKNYDFLP